MSKLFKLKEWLTLEEAAIHISSVLGEPATVADLYRFSLDGHLTLSVNFVNHATARKGKWVKTEDIVFQAVDMSAFFHNETSAEIKLPSNHEIRVADDDWVALDKPVVSIEGVWDLPMIGEEALDIEHEYQRLTSGLEVTLCMLDGAFVQQGDVICQLQTDFDDNEYQAGSMARKENIDRHLACGDVNEDKAGEIRAKFKADREEFLAERKNRPREEHYFPSGGLAEHDYVVVIRTQEVTRFIQSLEGVPSPDKPLTSKERNSLLVLIGALCKEVSVDPKQRGVASSLVEMTEILGAPLTDDTIRKILSQIEDAVSARNK